VLENRKGGARLVSVGAPDYGERRLGVALDDDQRQLETVNMCVDYLKHLTTISGVAVVVVLALLERPGADIGALAVPALLFGLAVVLCLGGIWLLIIGFATKRLGRLGLAIPLAGGVAGMVMMALCYLLVGAFISEPLYRSLVTGGLVIALVASAYVVRKHT
jgi:hypothetical protein